jgi:hypothetical protein
MTVLLQRCLGPLPPSSPHLAYAKVFNKHQGACRSPAAARQDCRLLLRTTVITTAEVYHVQGDEVRGLEVQARVFAVDGPNVVDTRHDYHHRTRRVSRGFT